MAFRAGSTALLVTFRRFQDAPNAAQDSFDSSRASFQSSGASSNSSRAS